MAALNKRQLRYAQLKNKVFDYYGWKCRHCKEDDKAVLVLDHILNDGANHRRQYGSPRGGGRTEEIYRDVVKSDFPNSFQTLCANCNMAKQKNRGILPRKRRNKYL